MKTRKCSKYYRKKFQTPLVIVQDGYHVLEAEIMIVKLEDKTRIKIHNDHVVFYNLTLLMKNEAYIRVKDAIRVIQLNTYSNI